MKQWSVSDVKYYKERVLYWKRRLGLHDWDIVVKIKDAHEDSVGAFCVADHEARLAEISLCPILRGDSTRPNNRQTLDQWALHELLHVLLTELRWYTVHTEKEKVTALEHQLIRTIENLILGDDR